MSDGSSGHEALWVKVVRSAEGELGAETVQKWLKPVSIKILQGDLVVLSARRSRKLWVDFLPTAIDYRQ